MTMTPPTIEAERLIEEAARRKDGWHVPAYEQLAKLPLTHIPNGHLAHRLADALRITEEARVQAERERDASDKALLDCYGTLSRHAGLLATRSITIAYEQDVIEAITAARSRAKPDGEEKKL